MIIARRVSYFPLALLASVILGLVIGSAFPQRVQAANNWYFWAHIPVGASSQTVYMNCGWHGKCDNNPTSGNGLDWDETDAYVYFAGAASWDSWYVTNAAYVELSYSPTSTCTRVRADIKNWYTDALLATEYYTHTWHYSGYHYLTVYAYSTPWGMREVAGVVSNPDLTGCPWTGTHVHAEGTGFDATNGGFPAWQSCRTAHCASYPNGTWVYYEDWTY